MPRFDLAVVQCMVLMLVVLLKTNESCQERGEVALLPDQVKDDNRGHPL